MNKSIIWKRQKKIQPPLIQHAGYATGVSVCKIRIKVCVVLRKVMDEMQGTSARL